MPGDTLERWFRRAVGNPLVRGGLTVGAGIVLGNILGFARSAVTAYLLGTHAAADALAIAISPLDTLNGILINTMLFAFVPMLMLREGEERIALFHQASRLFTWIFAFFAIGILLFAPRAIHLLGPGLKPEYVPAAVNILRITSISTLAAGAFAIYSALLYTERRFGPPAFYQASLNIFTIVAAVALWRVLGIYGFAIGYSCGACAQLAVVYFAARRYWRAHPKRDSSTLESATPWHELLAKPGSFLIYAGLIALNVIVTRAYATQSGPGMAAAFDYCIRCVNVVIAYLVMPVSNALLPEIGRLRRERRTREAFRLTDRTISIAALAAVASCIGGVLLRQPVIALLFQRGSFTAQSTQLVSGAFLGFAPSLIGWSLLELNSRALFALDRPWLPVCAAAIPVAFNLAFSAAMRSADSARFGQPPFIGLGASLGLLLAFAFLFVVSHARRKYWSAEFALEPREKLVPART
ncbi:MAG: murein biosynthesis integral membrane protein MurJ [Bryobacteraceae bacterium]